MLQEDAEAARQAREQEEELTKRTLMALNDMRIKFPGKSEEEAEFILDKVTSRVHVPQLEVAI